MNFLVENLHLKHGGTRWGHKGPSLKELLNNPGFPQREIDKGADLLYEARKIAETARRKKR